MNGAHLMLMLVPLVRLPLRQRRFSGDGRHVATDGQQRVGPDCPESRASPHRDGRGGGRADATWEPLARGVLKNGPIDGRTRRGGRLGLHRCHGLFSLLGHIFRGPLSSCWSSCCCGLCLCRASRRLSLRGAGVGAHTPYLAL